MPQNYKLYTGRTAAVAVAVSAWLLVVSAMLMTDDSLDCPRRQEEPFSFLALFAEGWSACAGFGGFASGAEAL